MPRTHRVLPTAIVAAAITIMAFAVPPLIDWAGRRTIPALGQGGGPNWPTPLGRAAQAAPAPPIPWHAQWINPDSALLVAVVGYTLVMLLGVWLWMGMLRLRERLRLSVTQRVTTAV
jgi:hypothetical protein